MMRRTIPYAVAVVATIVAVLAMMGVPGLSFGQDTVIHGSSPSDVYTLEERAPEDCAPIGVTADGVSIMPLQVELEAPSHILAYFSFDLSGLDPWEQAQVNPELGGDPVGEGSYWRFTGNAKGRPQSATVMKVFPDQDAGTHTVNVYAAVADQFGGVHGQLAANLESCVLTVFVMPVE